MVNGGPCHERDKGQRRSHSTPVERSAPSSPTIDVGHVFAYRGLLLDQVMMRREMADRIGPLGVSRDGNRRAAASPEVEFPPLAASARLRQEAGAAEGAERRRGLPDLLQRIILDRPEFEAR